MRRYILYRHNQFTSEDLQRKLEGRKALDVLTGLSLGLLADGEINSREAAFLKEWINRNGASLPDFVTKKIGPILEMLQGASLVSLDTLEELAEALMALVGLDINSLEINNKNLVATAGLPSQLIFDRPEMPISFEGHEVVITGKFSTSSRRDVIQQLKNLGAFPRECIPTQNTKLVLVGGKGSTDWSTSQLGNKIQKALELRANGYDIMIIPETYLPAE
jgi:NAD-dependent DNA ligase